MYKEYVKCDNCGNLILKGNRVFQMKGFCGIYCSVNCRDYVWSGHLTSTILNEDVILDCNAEKIIITAED